MSGSSRRSRAGLLLSTTGLALGLSAAAASAILPSPHIWRCDGNGRVKCGSNLRQLGMAMMLYANEHRGQYPATVAELLQEEITADVFVCPVSNDTPAITAATPQATAANVLARGHLSYVILSGGFSDPAPANAVLAYEPLTNHQGQGMNVLFGDYHVDFVQTPEAKKLLAELNAGHNPPRPEAMR